MGNMKGRVVGLAVLLSVAALAGNDGGPLKTQQKGGAEKAKGPKRSAEALRDLEDYCGLVVDRWVEIRQNQQDCSNDGECWYKANSKTDRRSNPKIDLASNRVARGSGKTPEIAVCCEVLSARFRMTSEIGCIPWQ